MALCLITFGLAIAGALSTRHYEPLGGQERRVAREHYRSGGRPALKNLPHHSLETCKNACDATRGCQSFMWCDRDYNRCWLYDVLLTKKSPTVGHYYCTHSYYIPVTVSGGWRNLICHRGGSISRTVEQRRAVTSGSSSSWGWDVRTAVSAGIEYDTPGKSFLGGAKVTANIEVSAGVAHDWSKSIERTTESGISFTVNCRPQSNIVCLWQWEMKFSTAESTAVWDSQHTRCSFSGISNPPPCPPGMQLDVGGTKRCRAMAEGQQKFSVPVDIGATVPPMFDGLSVSPSIFIAIGLTIALMIAVRHRHCFYAAQSTTSAQLIDVVE